MKKYITAGILILVVAGGWIVNRKVIRAKEGERSYRVYTTQRENFEKIIEVDGVVEARDTKLVYADRNLKVDDVIYKEGDYVRDGEIIMTFDPEDKNKITRELRKEEIKLRRLQRDLENARELHTAGGMSKVDMENIEFDIETTLINIEDYEEELAKMLDNIESPFDGTIISMIAEENYRVNTEVELFEMANLSDIIIVAEVPEYSIEGVEEGQRANVRLDAYSSEFAGEVTKISTLSTATTSKNDSSTSNTAEAFVEVEIGVKNLPKGVRPGFNSKVGIVISSNEDTVAVPRSALLEEDGREYIVFLDKENVATKLPVKTGISSGKLIQIRDLSVGRKVVIDPDSGIMEGSILRLNTDNKKTPERQGGKRS